MKCRAYSILEINQCTGVKGEEAGFGARGRPIDEHERVALPSIVVLELVGNYNVSWRVLR